MILISFPFCLLILKARWTDVSYDVSKNKRFAMFYSDISISKGPKVLIWPFFFLIRRLLLALVMVVCNETLILQVMTMVGQVVAAVILLGHI